MACDLKHAISERQVWLSSNGSREVAITGEERLLTPDAGIVQVAARLR